MTSTKPMNNEKKERKKRTSQPAYPAQDKVQAVLAVWTERCKPVDVCRQLSINPITFQQWQQRAMEGMLQALENRVNLSKGEALSPRLQALLQNRSRSATAGKLANRLEQINKLASPAPVAAKTA
jgi:transposase-like protein